MKLYFRYLFRLYLKNFTTLLIGISLLYLIVDLVGHYSQLPNSSNLQILYSYYTLLYGLDFLYPLALLFSFLVTLYQLVRRNELVIFYSSGFRRRDLLKPFFLIGGGITLLFYFLDSTQFAYSIEKAKGILKGEQIWRSGSYFLTWKGKAVSIGELNPIVGKAEEVTLFYFSPSNRLVKVVKAPTARFNGEEWIAPEVELLQLTEEKWERGNVKNFHFLKEFKPKVVSNLKSVNTISFTDALYALRYFKNLDTNQILAIALFKLTTPLVILFTTALLFLVAPIQIRIGNLSLFMVKSALLGVFLWGIQLLLFKFAKQGVLSPYWMGGVVVGVGVVLLYFLKRR